MDRRRILGIAKQDSKSRPYTPAEDRLLGTLPDEELARRLGRTPGAIEVRRVAFGIVMFGRHAGSRAGKPRGRVWTPEELALLGKVPDKELVLRLHRTAAAVRTKRYRLGLKDPSARKP